MIINTMGQAPLCPMDLGPDGDARHAEHMKTLNAFYEVAGDGAEFKNAVASNAYHEAAHKNRQMRLYVHDIGGTQYNVVTAYWQCPTCHFVLPAIATSVERAIRRS